MGRKKNVESLPIVNPHAAGIDVGSKIHYVCVGQAQGDIREFGVYSENLHQLCQ
jgi:transposase